MKPTHETKVVRLPIADVQVFVDRRELNPLKVSDIARSMNQRDRRLAMEFQNEMTQRDDLTGGDVDSAKGAGEPPAAGPAARRRPPRLLGA
jgi:hypothetical protein